MFHCCGWMCFTDGMTWATRVQWNDCGRNRRRRFCVDRNSASSKCCRGEDSESEYLPMGSEDVSGQQTNGCREAEKIWQVDPRFREICECGFAFQRCLSVCPAHRCDHAVVLNWCEIELAGILVCGFGILGWVNHR